MVTGGVGLNNVYSIKVNCALPRYTWPDFASRGRALKWLTGLLGWVLWCFDAYSKKVNDG